ncbi:hypothetical protein [Piscinibacter koreensis]|uniref:Uncharacterized protein n=1 Tax=Piscinibacter koreensis TaxID=2742824 RepID=A0A7Y6TWE3_9BURK|nr:hypothetical protein [Schlegelella koreensis]NUZ05990.1 hypothetical protein [Schlegelella koreensis]
MPHPDTPADDFEKTFVLRRRPDESGADYVRDTGEWIARCVQRALHLNPTLWASEVTPMVLDMSTVQRFRLMSPEDVAAQLPLPTRHPG